MAAMGNYQQEPKVPQATDQALARVLVKDLERALQDSQEEVVRLQAMVAQARALARLLEAKARPKVAQFPQENPPKEHPRGMGWRH
jgi:hypothetical protein